MTPTDRAKKLMAGVEKEGQGCVGADGLCDECWNRSEAGYTVEHQARATLAVAITLAEYAQWQDCEFMYVCRNFERKPLGSVANRPCPRCKALAAWERLFPARKE